MSGICDCGLTEFGRDVMRRMSELEMIVDLAHASKGLMSDILDLPSHECTLSQRRANVTSVL